MRPLEDRRYVGDSGEQLRTVVDCMKEFQHNRQPTFPALPRAGSGRLPEAKVTKQTGNERGNRRARTCCQSNMVKPGAASTRFEQRSQKVWGRAREASLAAGVFACNTDAQGRCSRCAGRFRDQTPRLTAMHIAVLARAMMRASAGEPVRPPRACNAASE